MRFVGKESSDNLCWRCRKIRRECERVKKLWNAKELYGPLTFDWLFFGHFASNRPSVGNRLQTEKVKLRNPEPERHAVSCSLFVNGQQNCTELSTKMTAVFWNGLSPHWTALRMSEITCRTWNHKVVGNWILTDKLTFLNQLMDDCIVCTA